MVDKEKSDIEYWECPGCHQRLSDLMIQSLRQDAVCYNCIEYRISDYRPILQKELPEEEPKIEFITERQKDGSWGYRVYYTGRLRFYDYQGNEPTKGHAGDAIRRYIRHIEGAEKIKEGDNDVQLKLVNLFLKTAPPFTLLPTPDKKIISLERKENEKV